MHTTRWFARTRCISKSLAPLSFAFSHSFHNVSLQEQPDQPSVGRRDRRALELVVDHGVGHLLRQYVRAEGARTRPHRLRNQLIAVPSQLLRAQQPEDDPLVVDYNRRLPALVANLIAHDA